MAEPEIIEDDGKAIEAKRLQEQCFLIYNFESFATSNSSANFENFIPIHGNPVSIVQKLLSIPNLDGLMSIKPYLLSSLVPQIRVYKVHYPTEQGEGVPYEMPFEDFLNPANLEMITASGARRGMGVGLKSFEWELLGTNPAESDNNIKAKLKLHFNTLEDFVVPRARHEDMDISYMNLVVPVTKFNVDKGPCGDKKEGTRSYNNKYFRLKVSVGYGTPTGSIWDNDPHGASLLRAIDHARQFYYLTLISHSLDFKEDGSLDLEVEYSAAMEGALVHPKADVLMVNKEAADNMALNDAERAAERKKTDAKVSAENDKNCGKKADDRETSAADAKKEQDKSFEEQEAEDRARLYNGILTELENAGALYSIEVTAEDLGEISTGMFGSGQDAKAGERSRTKKDAAWVKNARQPVSGDSLDILRTGISESASGDKDAASNFSASATDNVNQEIHYFHFGDLIEVALKCLYMPGGPPELSELKVITGPYVYYDPASGKMEERFNMCDIPISMNLFQIWFMDRVVKPQRKKYNLKQFIKDAVTTLVGAAMNPECFGKDYGRAPADLSLQMLQVPAAEKGQCRISGKNGQGKIGGKRVKNVKDIMPFPNAVAAEAQKAYSYLFMYVSSSGAKGFGPPGDSDGTREERDAKLGTYHFRVGSDSGLVKKIKFKKSDQPYAREARMEKAGELDGDSLREKYDADVELFGNAIFKPGMHVYIDPTTVGAGEPDRIATIAHRMGLGGYFLVTNVKSAIESGKFSTDLKCIWTASGTGKVPDDECGEGEKCDDGSPTGATAPSGTAPSQPPQ